MLKGPLEIRDGTAADRALLARVAPGAEALAGDRLLAWAGGELVGHALVRRVEVHVEGDWLPFGTVSALFVAPDARGFRVGSRLLAAALARHRGAGARGVMMRVLTSATQAIGMCEHAGFEALSHEADFRVPVALARSMKLETEAAGEEAVRAEWDAWGERSFPAFRGEPLHRRTLPRPYRRRRRGPRGPGVGRCGSLPRTATRPYALRVAHVRHKPLARDPLARRRARRVRWADPSGTRVRQAARHRGQDH